MGGGELLWQSVFSSRLESGQAEHVGVDHLSALRLTSPAQRHLMQAEALSSEVGTGSREESASEQKDGIPSRFNRNGAPVLPQVTDQ
jgi:hypothetical protein